jgi:formate hydrogenlyase subunit 6/NADH:ubiquinone oxidoreductase subunit I
VASLITTMLGTVVKNGFNKPATRAYPYVKREPFENARGQLVVSGENCIYCSLCARACPTNAIEVDRAGKMFKFHPLRCIVCGACVSACNKGSLKMDAHHRGALVKPADGGDIVVEL